MLYLNKQFLIWGEVMIVYQETKEQFLLDVYNDKIVGNDVNGKPGTEGGLSYDNRNCVLRAVLGV